MHVTIAFIFTNALWLVYLYAVTSPREAARGLLIRAPPKEKPIEEWHEALKLRMQSIAPPDTQRNTPPKNQKNQKVKRAASLPPPKGKSKANAAQPARSGT